MAYGIKEKTTKNNTLVSWLLEKMARGVKVYLELEEISKTGFFILYQHVRGTTLSLASRLAMTKD